MTMIQMKHLTFNYDNSADALFKDVSLTIDTSWKLGFIGRNGRGKTTFLKLLLGKYDYQGTIAHQVNFDYFPFEVKNPSLMVRDILMELCPHAELWELIKELSCLKVKDDVLWRPFNTLSDGEKTKVLLAGLFLKPLNFLLIDEPTNHLDATARNHIAAYLNTKQGFISISHDRNLLDGCVDHILAINRANIELCSGNYSSYIDHFEKIQENERIQNETIKKEIEHMKKASKQAAQWSNKVEASKKGAADKGYVGHKAAKMMKRSKILKLVPIARLKKNQNF